MKKLEKNLSTYSNTIFLFLVNSFIWQRWLRKENECKKKRKLQKEQTEQNEPFESPKKMV